MFHKRQKVLSSTKKQRAVNANDNTYTHTHTHTPVLKTKRFQMCNI